jgi:hypothetical protein
MFKEYKKIHRLGKEETDGILDGRCVIQEKVDGANVSIWLEDGVICMGSRSQKITEGFNGFCQYVRENEAIKNLFAKMPTLRLYGEWLVRHTIAYNELAYKHFYLFDIEDTATGVMLDPVTTVIIAKEHGIKHPQIFADVCNPTPEFVKAFAGKTELGEKGEGVVIKNPDFKNKFGEWQYAKVVTEEFKEDNGVVFGGNNKHSDTYWETYVVNKYMTLERIQKIINKVQPLVEKRLDLEHIPRITNTAYHDMLTEEIWDIQAKVEALDFKTLKRIAIKKAVQIYKEIITGDISVAHRMN